MTPRLRELKAKHARSKIDLDEPAYTLELAAEISGYEQALEDLKPALDAAKMALTYLDEVAPGHSRQVDKLPSLPNLRRTLRDALSGLEEYAVERPKIICLCGSTRFTDVMLVVQWEFSKQGIIVLGWNALPDSYFDGQPKANMAEEEGVKEILDELHKRKIDLANEVYVVNVDGYVGESTRSEINYAIGHGKTIHWLEAQDA